MSKIIVGVETVKTENGVAAGVAVYPVNSPAPIFTYVDRQGRRRTVGLEDFSRLSDVYRDNILRYLKQQALSWAVLFRRDGDRQAVACLAVARALERLKHFRPEALGCRKDIEVSVSGKPLPAEQVGFLTQHAWKDRRDAPWAVLAAGALAKAPRACMLVPR